MIRLYGKILRRILDRTFSFWQALGFHIVPNHFYQPVPDTRSLKESLWTQKSELIGINLNEERQIEFLSELSAAYKVEYDSFPTHKTDTPWEYYVDNDFFPSVDSEILYCMIRHFKPQRVIEVGSGNTTYLAAQAMRKNREDEANYDGELVAIDPYAIETVMAGFPGLSRLLRVPIQDMPLSEFDRLGKDDILFIDSSHVLSIGSDVHMSSWRSFQGFAQALLCIYMTSFCPRSIPKIGCYGGIASGLSNTSCKPFWHLTTVLKFCGRQATCT